MTTMPSSWGPALCKEPSVPTRTRKRLYSAQSFGAVSEQWCSPSQGSGESSSVSSRSVRARRRLAKTKGQPLAATQKLLKSARPRTPTPPSSPPPSRLRLTPRPPTPPSPPRRPRRWKCQKTRRQPPEPPPPPRRRRPPPPEPQLMLMLPRQPPQPLPQHLAGSNR